MRDYHIQVNGTAISPTSVVNSVSVYNCRVDVVRITKVNGALGIAETPVTIVNSMPCTIQWKTGREKYLFKKETHFLDAVLRCDVPAGVTIVNTDKITYAGDSYELVDVTDEHNLGKTLKILLKKVK